MTLDDVHERALAIGYTAADAELLEASLHYYIHPDIGVINKETGVTQLLQLAELHKPKLVIVDTLSRVIEADESASQPYHDAYRLAWSPLKRMGITAVRLDHTGSGGPWVPDKVDLVKHPEAPIHRLKGASTQPAPDVAEWVDIRIDRGRFPGSGRLGLLKNAREKAKADLTVACIVHCQRVIDTAIERQDGHVDRLVNKRLPTNRIEWSKQSLAELGGLVPVVDHLRGILNRDHRRDRRCALGGGSGSDPAVARPRCSGPGGSTRADTTPCRTTPGGTGPGGSGGGDDAVGGTGGTGWLWTGAPNCSLVQAAPPRITSRCLSTPSEGADPFR